MTAIRKRAIALTLAAVVAWRLATKERQQPDDEPLLPEGNTYGLPAGTRLTKRLRAWLRRQQREVLGTIPTIGSELPTHFADLADYDDPMVASMTPILSAYWDVAGKQARERVGLDPDDWKVTDPHTREQIEQAAFNFCEATNRTTSKDLNTALGLLRQELVEGIVERGDSLRELRKRVSRVFEGAEEYRAQRIAATEASRAVHAAELESARQSGVVAGFEWLLSADACPLCHMVAAEVKRVRLGQPFAIVGHNAHYATVRHPPLHPSCNCSVIEILSPEYGGPEHVDWRTPLDQPKPGPDYQPPEGLHPPEPRPAARDGQPGRYWIKGLPNVGFVQAPASKDARERVVWADVAKLDHAWLDDDPDNYVSPGGTGGGKPGAYEQARRFLAETAPRERIGVELGRVSLGKAGLSWIDGRHRFAALRDMGIRRVPVSVDRSEADAFRERFGQS